MSFSCDKEGGQPVAMILDIDRHTNKAGDANGTIVYLHKDNKRAVDDYDSDEEERKSLKGAQTREEPEDFTDKKHSRSRHESDSESEEDEGDTECTRCGGLVKWHDEKPSKSGRYPELICPSEREIDKLWEKEKRHKKDKRDRSPKRDKGDVNDVGGVRDSRKLSPYEYAGGEDRFRNSREGRAFNSAEMAELKQKSRKLEPDFEARDFSKLTHMQRMQRLLQRRRTQMQASVSNWKATVSSVACQRIASARSSWLLVKLVLASLGGLVAMLVCGDSNTQAVLCSSSVPRLKILNWIKLVLLVLLSTTHLLPSLRSIRTSESLL